MPARRVRERLAWLGWIVAALAIAVAATLAVPYFRTPAPIPEMRVEINTPATSDPISFAISPDGRRLVFVASDDGPSRIWLRPLDAVTAQPLAGTEGAIFPFWSPDSRSVAFFADGKLRRIDIGGGPPQTLADAGSPRGGTWSSDGIILFALDSVSPLFRVTASGDEAVPVTKLDPPRQRSHRFPQFLPGSQRFLFYAQGMPETQGVYLASLGFQETKLLTVADTAGVYAPPGWLLFMRQGTLVARHFDPARAELRGDPTTVSDPVTFNSTYNVGAFSVSAAGLVTYRAGAASRRQLTWRSPRARSRCR